MRLALAYGCDIVPVFGVGNSDFRHVFVGTWSLYVVTEEASHLDPNLSWTIFDAPSLQSTREGADRGAVERVQTKGSWGKAKRCSSGRVFEKVH